MGTKGPSWGLNYQKVIPKHIPGHVRAPLGTEVGIRADHMRGIGGRSGRGYWGRVY